MDKLQLLDQVRAQAALGTLTKNELNQAYARGIALNPGQDNTRAGSKRIGIGEVLYYIGGTIVFFGIGNLIFQHWSDLNLVTKILSTFGAGLAAYIIGVALNKHAERSHISQAFFLISALVLPIGLAVIFYNAGADVGSAQTQTVIAAILLAGFGLSYYFFRKNIFAVFDIFFATWMFFSGSSWIAGTNPIWSGHFFEYRALAVGLSYMFTAFGFSEHPKLRRISPWLYALGVLFFLGAAMALGGYRETASGFWESFFVVLVFAAIYISVYVQSQPLLIFSSLFLMGYVLKITFEYFSGSFGWAFSLIIAGFALIGIGYLAYYVNRKYLNSNREATD